MSLDSLLQTRDDADEVTLFYNAQLVLPDKVMAGSVVVVGKSIVRILPEQADVTNIVQLQHSNKIDFAGDYCIPGLIELHTDHLESHYRPRPGVVWNPIAAIQAHDAQIAASGITTVIDCLRMGRDDSNVFADGEMREIASALQLASQEERLRAEHFIHLRCEVSAPDVLEQFEQFDDCADVRLVSLMDHAPGQRQFTDLSVYESYYRNKDNMDELSYRKFVKDRVAQSERYSTVHRQTIASRCRDEGICMASHDDACVEHVDEAFELGVSVSEFPTTIEAAKAAKRSGMAILMGAPNVVRGGSHSGNVSALALAEGGMLDILSSDYVPSSLMQAVFMLAFERKACSLSESMALVTSKPAEIAGFSDRGTLELGRRADLARVRYSDGVPVVKSVWREGNRII